MQFLILRGHSRLVPQGGISEFPDAILNAKRLDLYNLYREVFLFKIILVNLKKKAYCEIFPWISGSFERRLSCWEWDKLERTSVLKDEEPYNDQ